MATVDPATTVRTAIAGLYARLEAVRADVERLEQLLQDARSAPSPRATSVDAGRLLLKPAEAAALLSVSQTRVYGLINAGELRTVRVGVRLRIPRSAVEQYVADLERAARAEEERLRVLLARPKRRRG